MRMRHLLPAVLLLLLVASLQAQTFRGGIEGNVADTTGAAVTGAQVTAANTGTGLTRSSQTDDQGNYAFFELPLGTYTVTATKSGFRTAKVEGVKLEVSARERVNVTLQPGQVQETVEVKGEVPMVETTINNMGGTIEGETAAQLPINGRDFTKLLVLVPGATGDAGGGTDSPGSFGLFSVNGSRGRSNNYLLDGTDMNDGYRNLPAINEAGVFGTPATILPVDALAEVPVIASGEAEYGRNSGSIVNLVTKSGSNQLHGSVYEYFRNNALDARNFFNTEPVPQNVFQNNQFGGSLGGPIVKDKTFFFVAYEGQREAVGMTFTNHLPSQEQITNFITGGGTVNPIVCNLLRLLSNCTAPNPNFSPWGQPLPATGLNGADVIQTVRARNRVDSLIGKIDQHIGQKDLLTGRYFFGDSDQSFPLALLGGGSVPGYNTVTPTRVQILSLSYTHVHSSKLLMEFRGGWNRFNESFSPEDSSFNPASIGLNNTAPNDPGLPLIKIGAPGIVCGGPSCPVYAPIGANASVPRGRVDTNWQAFANASYNTGKHNLKWGYEFRRTFVNGFFDTGFRSLLVFPDFGSFLAGDTGGTSSHQLQGDTHRHTFQNSHAFYLQDNWRMTPRITVNLGLRWDYFGVIGEKNGLFSVFDPTQLPLPAFGGPPMGTCTPSVTNFCLPARPVSQLYPKDYNNFSPRVSFAWDIFGKGKTVLRGGYGIFYDAFSQDFFVGQLPWPTFNAGPAYNYLGPTNPATVAESYSVAGNLGVGPCGPGLITIPNSLQCAGPLFTFGPGFGNDTFTVDQKIRTPYIQNYNLNLQQALGPKIALQVGYVGSKGTKLFQYIDINQIMPVAGTDPLTWSNPYGFQPGMGFGYVLQFGSRASSSYNSLQTSLRIRDLHGLNATLNYTWSHSIDNASDGQDYVPNATQPDNSFNPAGERARSNFDQRHRLTFNYTYEFPKAHSMKWLLDGWMLDGVVTLSSGMPFTISWGTETFLNDFNHTNEFYGRPDVCGLGAAYPCPAGVAGPFSGTGVRDPVSGAPLLVNMGALQVPCNYDPSGGIIFGCNDLLPNSHMGNLPRNAFTGPSFRNWDFSLVKNTALGERVKMQIRADFFNILNHPNFGNPLWPGFEVDMLTNGINPITQGSGQVAGSGIGFVKPTTTPDVGLGNPFLGGGGPRDIQLAVKFTF